MTTQFYNYNTGSYTTTPRRGTLTARIFSAFKRRPVMGFTSDELFTALRGPDNNLDFKTVTGRIGELKARGLLVDTGTTRVLVTGKQGQVLRINPNVA